MVALVTTIVVLLILAGITIMYVMGDNSVFKVAKEAELETRGGAVEEARDMWKNQNLIAQYANKGQKSLASLLGELLGEKLITEEEKQEIEKTGQVTIGSRTIVFEEPIIECKKYLLRYNDENSLIVTFWEDSINEIVYKELDLTDEEMLMKIVGYDGTFEEFIKSNCDEFDIVWKINNLKEYFMFDIYMLPSINSSGTQEELYNETIRLIKEQYKSFYKDENPSKVEELTEEELWVALRAKIYNSEEIGTFQEAMQEMYGSEDISKVYESFKEYWNAVYYLKENTIEKNINDVRAEHCGKEVNIEIIGPNGEVGEDTFEIPFEPAENIFTIKYLGKEIKFKISIGQYALVIGQYELDSPIKARGYTPPNAAYALDVKNKKFLNINQAKMVINMNVDIDNKYLLQYKEHNYLDFWTFISEYENDKVQSRTRGLVYYLTTLFCNEGEISGYVVY